MEPIKFWAETEQDTENFFNHLRAMNIPDDLEWTTSSSIKVQQEFGIGWLLDSTGDVTYYSTKDSFDGDNAEEFFFFPIPGDEFVETSELDGQKPSQEYTKHSHYKKNVEHLKFIDVYRVLDLYEVTDPAIAHAVKKLLVAGGRGAGKDIAQDVDEAIDSLLRWKEMKNEDSQ